MTALSSYLRLFEEPTLRDDNSDGDDADGDVITVWSD